MSNLDVARQCFSHFDKSVGERTLADYQPYFDALADDTVLEYASPAGAERLRGKQAVIDHVSALFTSLAGDEQDDVVALRPVEILGDGERLVATWSESTKSKETGELGAAREVAVLIDFREGKVARMVRLSQ